MMRRIFSALLALAWLTSSVLAQTPNQNILRMNGKPGWVLSGANIVDLNFARGLYYSPGATGALVNSRNTPETCANSSGNWRQAASGQNCVTNLGVGAWEARTNSIRNNTAQGGSAGVYPTNWTNAQSNGVTIIPDAPVVVNGVNTVTFNISGTATATITLFVSAEANSQIATSYGQTWTQSSLLSYTGSILTIELNTSERNSSGTSLLDHTSSPLVLNSNISSYSYSATLTNAANAFVYPRIYIMITNGSTYSGALTVGWPQLELNPTISASLASATDAGAGSVCLNGTDTFTVAGGTGTAATISATVAGGVITGPLTVVTAGSYSVFPPSPATLNGGSCTTQPTANLTPVNNSSLAFATPPILTSGTAITRAADNISIAIQPCSGRLSGLGIGTPFAPTGYPLLQQLWTTDAGSASNKLFGARIAATGGYQVGETISGTPTVVSPSGVWAVSTAAKLSGVASNNNLSGAANNGASVTASPSGVVSTQNFRVGVGIAGNSFNGYVSRAAFACGTSLLND